MTSLVRSHTGLEDLLAHALKHMGSLGYAAGTLANSRRVYEEFLRLAEQEAERESLSTALVQRFLEHQEIPREWTETEFTFHQRHRRTVMGVLRELALHGCLSVSPTLALKALRYQRNIRRFPTYRLRIPQMAEAVADLRRRDFCQGLISQTLSTLAQVIQWLPLCLVFSVIVEWAGMVL
jgi:hypothetical protein